MLNRDAYMNCESVMQQLRHYVDRMHFRCMSSRVQKVLRHVSDSGVPKETAACGSRYASISSREVVAKMQRLAGHDFFVF